MSDAEQTRASKAAASIQAGLDAAWGRTHRGKSKTPAALRFFRHAAALGRESGNTFAALTLMKSNSPAERDLGVAELKTLADRGVRTAELQYARELSSGFHMPRDENAARGYFAQAVAHGHCVAIEMQKVLDVEPNRPIYTIDAWRAAEAAAATVAARRNQLPKP